MLRNNEQKNQVQKQQRVNERSETMAEKKRGDLQDAETKSPDRPSTSEARANQNIASR